MNERDSSTLNEDCWHSTYGNFCKRHQAPSWFFGLGLGTKQGLDCGLDCWTGLMDWIAGLNLFLSHDFHPIKCCKFGYSNYLTKSCTSPSHYVLGNVHERTMHKLHGRMCIMNSWCTCSELKAPSDYSKHKRAWKVLTKGSLLNYVLSECEEECWWY